MRSLLHASMAFALLGLTSLAPLAQAQSYPTRPVKLIVPQPPGSGADVVGRMLADSLARQFGQAVYVENKPGANGIIASEQVAKEAPDGYNLLQTSVSLVSFNQFMYKRVPYDPFRDFTLIAPLADASFVLLASRHSGIKSWDDFVKHAKAHPGQITFGSGGTGNSTHLYPEMIARREGLSLRHIPYKGPAAALLSLVSGETDVMVSPTVVAMGQIAANTVNVLAQSGDTRSPKLPNVPLLKELDPRIPALPGWYAIEGPAKMDPKRVEKVSRAVNTFLADPAVRTKLIDQYLMPIPGTAADIEKRGKAEAKIWGDLIRELHIEAD